MRGGRGRACERKTFERERDGGRMIGGGEREGRGREDGGRMMGEDGERERMKGR